MDVEVAGAGHETAGADAARRRGRATSSPPQFGQTPSIASVHETQKVHSNVQIRASPSGESVTPQRSPSVRISRAIAYRLGVGWGAECRNPIRAAPTSSRAR